MSKFEVGAMFWGKAQSYPWWPCVIVETESGEWLRRIRKFGIQYHVQFIGNEYDPSWISEEFLVEFHGKDRFEQYVINQLSSNLTSSEKLKFDMRMSQSIKELWNQACNDAEVMYSMDHVSRLIRLPKSSEAKDVIKYSMKRSISKETCTGHVHNSPIEVMEKKVKERKKLSKKLLSNIKENEDKIVIKTECKEVINKSKENKKHSSYEEDEYISDSYKNEELSDGNDIALSENIEQHCLRAYLAQEIQNLDNTICREQNENALKDRWSALDIQTKLLYVNDEVNYMGTLQSKVSGRRIKIPSRLRRIEDIAKIKRLSRGKCFSEPSSKRSRKISNDSSLILSVKDECVQPSKINSPNLSSNIFIFDNDIQEAIDESLWTRFSIQDCLIHIMKVIFNGDISDFKNGCCHCLTPVLVNDKIVSCTGPCKSTYHSDCAVQNKIFRINENNLCVTCFEKKELCCICKNSKPINKNSVVKCEKQNCHSFFHITCLKVFTFTENVEDSKVICPYHSCLTCSREDNKHQCNDIGTLVSCIKCPSSYHANLVCIPAGCEIVNKEKIICYRHFNNKIAVKRAQFLRCFLCFKENATLKCCQCRAIFHTKCLGLAAFSDQLKDFVCSTCKLEQPVFYGQIMWIEVSKKWKPAEVIASPLSDDCVKSDKSIVLNDLKNDIFYYANRCELIPFVIGLSVLKDVINATEKEIQLATLRNMFYWNWRSRVRPVKSEKFPLLGQSELMIHSIKDFHPPDLSVETFKYTDKTIFPKTLMKFVSSPIVQNHCCTSSCGTCSNNACNNFVVKVECNNNNCTNVMCNNRNFAKGSVCDPIILHTGISCKGVKLSVSVGKGEYLGECTGTVIPLQSVFKSMQHRKHLSSVSYIFQLSGDLFLNCEDTGNNWRYLNHSCNPNAKITCKNDGGYLRLAVSSLKSINKEEVTIDYLQSGLVLKYGFLCHCQSSNCLKVIGPTSIFLNESVVLPRCCIDNMTKGNKEVFDQLTDSIGPKLEDIVEDSQNNPITDDSILEKVICFKCGNHGELVTCDRGDCNKRYHLLCVEAVTKPKGVWLCPQHFCYYCGQTATKFCEMCPISCCKSHLKSHENHTCTNSEYDENSDPMTFDGSIENIGEMFQDDVKEVKMGEKENSFNDRMENKRIGHSVVEEGVVGNDMSSVQADKVGVINVDNAKHDVNNGSKECDTSGKMEHMTKNANVASNIDAFVIEKDFIDLPQEDHIHLPQEDSIHLPQEDAIATIDNISCIVPLFNNKECDIPERFTEDNLLLCPSENMILKDKIDEGNNCFSRMLNDGISVMEDDRGETSFSDFTLGIRRSLKRAISSDEESIRYEILPCKIKDDEDKIISPPIIDD